MPAIQPVWAGLICSEWQWCCATRGRGRRTVSDAGWIISWVPVLNVIDLFHHRGFVMFPHHQGHEQSQERKEEPAVLRRPRMKCCLAKIRDLLARQTPN